jgi:hypothetical protein
MTFEPASDAAVARLVGVLYETAPMAERRRLLDCLLPSMGVLSLVAIANGVFARIRLRSDWAPAHVRLQDVQPIQAVDVVALVERVQQTRVEAIDDLVQWVMTSPILAGSAAAALLLAVLMQHAQARKALDAAGDPKPGTSDGI